MTQTRLPDYSAWLTPERIAVEDAHWQTMPREKQTAQTVAELAARMEHSCPHVMEWGCGTGVVASLLPDCLPYHGFDANAGCISRARDRNPTKAFAVLDVRRMVELQEGVALHDPRVEIGVALAFLKHFHADEWPYILQGLLWAAHCGVFSMPVSATTHDDGTEWPHLWVSPGDLDAAVQAAGHEIVAATSDIEIPYSDTSPHWARWPAMPPLEYEWLIVTRRKER